MFELKYHTPIEWAHIAVADFDSFLQDHAAAEKKAASMAMTMLSHYQDRTKLVKAMVDLALEEMIHFKQVLKLMTRRGVILANDEKDPYINEIRKMFRHTRDEKFLDRMLVAGVIEARGHERFSLISQALPEGKDKIFYDDIARSEEKHKNLFVELAIEYFPEDMVYKRLEEILVEEGRICSELPFRAALH
ncbi:MAG: tRNA-(ms[2]io[6]A)-hydroxylase [Thalassotalea sp.]|nr:tRNA-(ms[2]io[6]A)-hydroxylase [Thalassotalea sp.]MDG2393534.1 tRNA-(ms[2]io[6]A)-hydroxylase [Thalassotalea sp.]